VEAAEQQRRCTTANRDGTAQLVVVRHRCLEGHLHGDIGAWSKLLTRSVKKNIPFKHDREGTEDKGVAQPEMRGCDDRIGESGGGGEKTHHAGTGFGQTPHTRLVPVPAYLHGFQNP